MMLDEAKNLVEICLMLLLLLAHWGQIVCFLKVVVVFNRHVKAGSKPGSFKVVLLIVCIFYTCLMKVCYDTLIEIRGHSTTTWTELCHFLAPSPPHLVYVVIECPLSGRLVAISEGARGISK